MRLNPFNSFSGKIFFFTVILVILTTITVAFDYVSQVHSMLNESYRRNSLEAAEKYAKEVETRVQEIEYQLASLAQTVADNQKAKVNLGIKQIKEKTDGFKGLYAYIKKNSHLRNLRNYGQVGRLNQSIAEQLKSIRDQQISSLVISIDKNHLGIVRRMSIAAADESFWIVAAIGRDFLEPLAATQGYQRSFILDHSGYDILSRKHYSKFLRSKKASKKILDLLATDAGASYFSKITESSRKVVNISAYRIPRYNLSVILHKEISDFGQTAEAILIKIAEKVGLIVLVSIMLGYLIIRSITLNLAEVFQGTMRIAQGNFQSQVRVQSKDEIGILAAAVNWMGAQIASLLASEKEKTRLEQELQTAQTVQNTFFKETYFENNPFKVSSYYTPASECGGDWWGHFSVQPGVELIIIGDATGHGVPAALVTAMAFATSNLCADLMTEGRKEILPSEILYRVNSVLNRSLKGQLCMTYLAMIFDSRKNTVTYANAGHVFPLLVPKDSDDDRIDRKRRKKLKWPLRAITGQKKSSNILGISEDETFYNEEFALRPGDRIILYTDGLTEAVNKDGKMLGTRGLTKFIQNLDDISCTEITDKVVEQAIAFNANGTQFDDDFTLVVIEYEDQSEEAVA